MVGCHSRTLHVHSLMSTSQMLIFCLIVILQLIAAQSILVVDPNAIRGPGACQSQRSAVDLAIRSISQSVRGIISTVSLIPMCGDGLWT